MSDIQKVEEAFALTLLELQTSRELVVELKKEVRKPRYRPADGVCCSWQRRCRR